MDFIHSPLFVILLLGAITTAAVVFEPARSVGAWREVAERYATDLRPRTIAFSGESVEIGVHNFARISAGLDDDGFWIIYEGPTPRKAPDCVLIPWDCIRFRQDKQGKQNFQIRGKKPIELMVSVELGDAMQRRSDRYEVEDQL